VRGLLSLWRTHEIQPDELIIQAYELEQDPAGGVSLEFQRFEDLLDGLPHGDGRTA